MNGPRAFLILADESAGWRIAGLAQLDRVVLALNELVEVNPSAEIAQAVIFWDPNVAPTRRWLPRHARITRVSLTESVKSVPSDARVLHTRLFLQRNGMENFLEGTSPLRVEEGPNETADAWNDLSARFKAAIPTGPRASTQPPWRWLESAALIPICEKEMLGQSGKSQDGIVSRFLNRPLSRMVSTFLLRYDLSPTTLTLSLFILPIVAFCCLASGYYVGIVAGALLFQLYSVLDGCDGEIARATYRESTRGGRIDDFLDMLGSILFVTGLGLGLFQSRSSLYLLEGICGAAVIAANEWVLRSEESADAPDSQKLTATLYPRHRRLLAGRAIFSERFLWWAIQFTKRDVAILFFLVLALIDQSPWILHLWLIVSTATLTLSLRSRTGPYL
jgi:hypothetical protein